VGVIDYIRQVGVVFVQPRECGGPVEALLAPPLGPFAQCLGKRMLACWQRNNGTGEAGGASRCWCAERGRHPVSRRTACLLQYTWDKQVETWVKKSGILGGAGKDPTVISPKQYSRRFRCPHGGGLRGPGPSLAAASACRCNGALGSSPSLASAAAQQKVSWRSVAEDSGVASWGLSSLSPPSAGAVPPCFPRCLQDRHLLLPHSGARLGGPRAAAGPRRCLAVFSCAALCCRLTPYTRQTPVSSPFSAQSSVVSDASPVILAPCTCSAPIARDLCAASFPAPPPIKIYRFLTPLYARRPAL
jgi:hypothetical protein